MSGWLMLAILAAAAAAGLWSLGLRGALFQLGIAAILFGCAGYAFQGRPALPGAPSSAEGAEQPIPLTNVRHAFFGDFAGNEHWLAMSESFARRGRTQQAVGVLRAAIREHPDDPQLWVGMGNALVDHSRVLTPAADFAYRRAAELSPGHPAPLFFMGLALARSGEPQAAVLLWKEALARSPADASWRPLIEDSVAALEQPAQRDRAGPTSRD